MTKEEHYKKAGDAVKSVIGDLTSLVSDAEEEDITCYYIGALDEPIQNLINAKVHMAIAEEVNK